MLRIVHKLNDLRFSELMQVYAETNAVNGKEMYPAHTPFEQLREVELDFYTYLQTVFFCQENSFYAIWEAEGRYLSALRIEPYADGLLLCGLETVPIARQQGYAYKLIIAVINYLAKRGSVTIYSHVSKQNSASLNTHVKCGFSIIKDHAVYSDGSVLHSSYTLAYEYKKSET